MIRKLKKRVQFMGRTIEVFEFGPDVLAEVDGKEAGQFLSVGAAVNFHQKAIAKEAKEKK